VQALRTLLGAIVGATLVAGCGQDGTRTDRVTEPRPGTAVPGTSFERLPFPPTDLPEPSIFGAGDVLVMISGTRGEPTPPADRVFVYEPGAESWAESDAPFSDSLHFPGAVWTGEHLVVVGAPCSEPLKDSDAPICIGGTIEAASYSPSDRRWERLLAPSKPSGLTPGAPLVQGLGWTGRHAAFAVLGPHDRAILLFDPARGTWTEVRGSNDSTKTYCVVGGRLVRMGLPGAQPGAFTEGRTPGSVKTDRHDPDRREWIALDDTPIMTSNVPLNTRCQGGEAAIVTSDPSVPVYWFSRDQAAWEALPPVPDSIVNVTPARFGATRVLWPDGHYGNYYVLHDGTATWLRVPKPDPRGEAWVRSWDDRLLLLRFALSLPPDVDLSVIDPVRYADEQAANG
jgi:hypothetical protein